MHTAAAAAPLLAICTAASRLLRLHSPAVLTVSALSRLQLTMENAELGSDLAAAKSKLTHERQRASTLQVGA